MVLALISMVSATNLFNEETQASVKKYEAKIYGCTKGYRFLALQKGRCNKSVDYCVKFNQKSATIGKCTHYCNDG